MNIVNLQKFKDSVAGFIMMFLWRLIQLYLKSVKNSQQSADVFLIAADKKDLIGSKGDEAMLKAAIEQIRSQNQDVQIVTSCIDRNCENIAHDLGLRTVNQWVGPWMPLTFLRQTLNSCPKQTYIMGADVMDGYYSPIGSLKMVIAADILSRSGSQVNFLGFSFNRAPSKLLKKAFLRLDNQVRIYLRDPISFERFQCFTGRSGCLVADTAFLLTPTSESSVVHSFKDWALVQQHLGRKLLALNYHTILFKQDDDVWALEASMLTMIKTLSDKYKISWVLLPHDDREYAGDLLAMKSLNDHLQDSDLNYYWFNAPPQASEVKGLIKSVDGVVTGRMHLSIAALGQGVPVLVLTYQGKFAGLLQHFGLPEWIEVSPASAMDSDYLTNVVERFIVDLPLLTEQVVKELPAVKSLALKTFNRER